MYTCILTCIHVYFVQALCSVMYAVFYNVYLIIKFFISLTGLDRVTSYVSNGLFLVNDMQPPPPQMQPNCFFVPKDAQCSETFHFIFVCIKVSIETINFRLDPLNYIVYLCIILLHNRLILYLIKQDVLAQLLR